MKAWTMWKRDKGTFGIAHLLKETKDGIDHTICGMEYNHDAEQKTDGMAQILRCNDCEQGRHNEGDLRSASLILSNIQRKEG